MTKNIIKFLPWIICFVLVAVFYFKSTNLMPKVETTQVSVHKLVLEKIENLGKLELVKYTFRDVLEHKNVKKIMGFETSSKVLLILSGEAVGCIDLTKVKTDNIIQKGDTVTITMPQPEICYTKINHKDSKVYQTNVTLFDNEGKLIDGAYKEAEQYMNAQALKTDILDRSKVNAEKLLKPMFEGITGKKVFLVFK